MSCSVAATSVARSNLRLGLACSNLRLGLPLTLFPPWQWAHPTSTPEPGGLLCAMPLQAVLLHRLQSNEECRWTAALEQRLQAELPSEEAMESAAERKALLARCADSTNATRWLPSLSRPVQPSQSRWRGSLPLTYRLATSMCNEALGRMRRGLAGSKELELWKMQVAALEVRGHVCLVLSTRQTPAAGLTAEAVTLNRLKASAADCVATCRPEARAQPQRAEGGTAVPVRAQMWRAVRAPCLATRNGKGFGHPGGRPKPRAADTAWRRRRAGGGGGGSGGGGGRGGGGGSGGGSGGGGGAGGREVR